MDITVIFSQMLQLFLILFLGWVLFRIHLFDQDMNRRITRLLLDVTLPCTILNSVLSQTERPAQDLVALTFLTASGMYLLLPVISFLLVKAMHLPKNDQGMYIFMSTYGNVGFMGFPVIEAVFGPDAIFYAAIFNVMFNLSCFSIGLLIIHYGSGKKASINWRDFVKPSTIVSAAAVILYLLNLKLPSVLSDTVRTTGAVTTPLSMMLIGSTLATMNLKEILGDWHVYPFAVVRQFVLPLILWPLLKFLIPDSYLLGITFLLLLMPSANTCVLFATRYHRSEKLAAKTVFITTLMTMITIPLLIYLCTL